MSLVVVPRGSIATIVTCLEMLAPPPPAPPLKSALKLERWRPPIDPARYRALFRSIGAPWLWRGRLVQSESELVAVLDAGTTQVHVATRRDGTPQGLLELDFAQPATCELAYFGLVPEMVGRGHGQWLMAHALRLAWASPDHPGIARVWVHTCDLDSPAALGFYQKSGFTPFERWVETYPDPRLDGTYTGNPAPRIALI